MMESTQHHMINFMTEDMYADIFYKYINSNDITVIIMFYYLY